MSNRFLITYKSGLKEEVLTDAVDVADQINRSFGLTVAEAEDFGVEVELLAENDAVHVRDVTQEPTMEELDKLTDPDAASLTPETDPAQIPPITADAASEGTDSVSATVEKPEGAE